MLGAMLRIFERSIAVGSAVNQPCSDEVYAAWIKRVKENGTPVKAGDQYVWIYVQLLPPKLVNCLVTVLPEDANSP